jgi:RNA polymerase sigma-70 factor (ECF subfamily)
VKGSDSAADPALASLYAASYARLVAVVGTVAQDRGEAEEAVQDAFVRLIGQWSRVRDYDQPEAWVRRVALGFVSNRRRKVRNGLRAAARQGVPAEAAGELLPPLDLRGAVAALPRPQREVLVLRELGFTLQETAFELRLPVGTVKSRLARARSALSAHLVEGENEHV